MTRLLLVLAVLCFSNAASAQELVPDPGFEFYNVCPNIKPMATRYWYSPSKATPDYFNMCAYRGMIRKPHIPWGWIEPHAGNGFAGFKAYVKRSRNYREYVEIALREPLKKDSLYAVEFYLALSAWSNRSVSSVGLYLGRKANHKKIYKALPCQPQFTAPSDTSARKRWIRHRFIYRAGGGERYVTIGNFNNDRHTPLQDHPLPLKEDSNTYDGAYYFVDDVSVKPFRETETEASVVEHGIPGPGSDDTMQVGDRLVIEDIYFDTDKWELRPESWRGLEKLLSVLINHPSYVVEISGHTDSTGNEEHNLALSQHRAEVVVRFLTENGISAHRLIARGYASSFPIADNKTVAGRSRNRRTELRLLDK